MLNNKVSKQLRVILTRYTLNFHQLRQLYRAVYCNQYTIRKLAPYQLNSYIKELIQ